MESSWWSPTALAVASAAKAQPRACATLSAMCRYTAMEGSFSLSNSLASARAFLILASAVVMASAAFPYSSPCDLSFLPFFAVFNAARARFKMPAISSRWALVCARSSRTEAPVPPLSEAWAAASSAEATDASAAIVRACS